MHEVKEKNDIKRIEEVSNPKREESEECSNQKYSLPSLEQLKNYDELQVIYGYKYTVGLCFYDNLLFCMRKSQLRNNVTQFRNGLDLKRASLLWLKDLKEKNLSLYDEFSAIYLYFIEVASVDFSVNEDSNDIYIQGCQTIEDHIEHMLQNPYKYCRNIDLAIITTFLDIDIHVYTDNNEGLTKMTTVVPKNKDEGATSTRPFTTIYFKNAHYSPIMEKPRKKYIIMIITFILHVMRSFQVNTAVVKLTKE